MNSHNNAIKAFEESEYGEKLKKQIRFASFKPAHISNEEWVQILGADVHNLNHMRLMQKLCKSFAKHEKHLSNEDCELLEQVASIHDWAEAIIGDIPAPQKTEQDKEIEKMHLHSLLEEFQIQNKERILGVLFDTNDPLHETFSLYEKIGYFRTALIAWKKIKSTQDKELSSKLEDLIKSVLQRQLPEFIKLYKESIIIQKLFQTKKRELIEILEYYNNTYKNKAPNTTFIIPNF